jgi:nucleoid-associated protein YgaU
MVTVLRLEAVTISNPDESTVTGVDASIRLTPPELQALMTAHTAGAPLSDTEQALGDAIAAAIVAGDIAPL